MAASEQPLTTQTSVTGGPPEALAIQNYRLRVDGARTQEAFTGDKQRVLIGTDAGCDLVLEDPKVSRRHCQILITEQGYRIEDLGSKNGTRIDGTRVVSAYLEPGQGIQVGNSRLTFEPTQEISEIPIYAEDHFGELIGPSLEMRALFAMLDKVSDDEATVLIEGESGTGKELIVQEIHRHSGRSDSPLVVFDCSAVPENLMESELFGHVKGAFTGATSDRAGAFRQADKGTLFLDEIGELPLELQPKLLRALESRQVRPVGGSKVFDCDVRIVAATNRNLAEEVKKGAFRQDLYFRLNVVRIRVPALRDRPEDVPALAAHFLRLSSKDDSASLPAFVGDVLRNHDWPGNVRELKNFVDRFRLFGADNPALAASLIDQEDLGSDEKLRIRYDLPYKEVKSDVVSQLEILYFKRLLAEFDGKTSDVAEKAGMHPKYLEELVRKHGLKKKRS